MSDNLGPNQTRVLDLTDRSFETVVYQKKKPPLSCEHNLSEALSTNDVSTLAKSLIPSGWDVVGPIVDGNTAPQPFQPGDVVTSNTSANAFKLIGQNLGMGRDLSAWINGQRVVIKGVNSSTEDNIINLPAPPAITTRVDFVFLEVWRKLLGTSDVVYKNGCVQYQGINPTNDLVDPAIGVETSLRIQLQYRIRVETTHLDEYPDGFTPDIYAQGSQSAPLTCTLARFAPVQGDPGLWRSGNGDQASQSTLGTVDGYTYAIPMFAVSRRNPNAYDPNNQTNGAGKSLADFLLQTASDRPDGKYSDMIAADDILDLRHYVTEKESLSDIPAQAFDKLINGKLREKMEKSTLGGEHFGTILVRANNVGPVDLDGAEHIFPVITTASSGVRRVFSKAQIDQPDTLKVFDIYSKSPAGGVWAVGNTVTLNLSTLIPGVPATVLGLDSLWMTNISSGAATALTNFTPSGVGTSTLVVTINSGSNILGTTNNLTLDTTLRFASGPHGLTHLPEQFLEARMLDADMPLAMTPVGFPVRGLTALSTSKGLKNDRVLNPGANKTEAWNFGHQMVHHIQGLGMTHITFPMVLNGYNILGVAWLKVNGVPRTMVSVQRNTVGYENQYLIDAGNPPIPNQADIEVGLYTGTKFFQGNKQGRAITDTFEMREISMLANGGTTYTLDATNAEILKIASNVDLGGDGFAYVDGVQVPLATNNMGLPTDATKSRADIVFSYAPTTGQRIEVPVLLKGGLLSGEGATFFYSNVPYQGTLDSSAMGSVLSNGPAIVTTAGSGSIVNYTYTKGIAKFYHDGTTVTGNTDTHWSTVRPGWTIRATGDDSSREFQILEVYDDQTLFLTSPASIDTTNTSYVITGWDVPADAQANIVDRLPILDSDTETLCKSDDISTALTDPNSTIATRIISEQQGAKGPLIVGVGVADRGRSKVHTEGLYGVGALGVRFEKLDSTGNNQRTYQAYAFNEAGTGKVKLMVVASESDGATKSRYFDENIGLDTVDLFDMPGRPLVLRS